MDPTTTTVSGGAEPVVRMLDIKKQYGQVFALRGMSLDLHKGEVVGIVGDNGAGKTTLVKVLCGAIAPSAGRILLDGTPVAFRSPHEARLQGIEIVYQDLAVMGQLDVSANVFLGRELTRRIFGFRILDTRTMQQRTRALMRRLDPVMENRIFVNVDQLSGGQRQSVAIARAIVFDPKVIILDEPTAALSVEKIEVVLTLIRQLKAAGLGIILISHRLQDIMSVCDRVVVMKRGSLVRDLNVSTTDISEIVRLMVTGGDTPVGAGVQSLNLTAS